MVPFQLSLLWGCILPPTQVSYWQMLLIDWTHQFHLSWLLLTSEKLFKSFLLFLSLKFEKHGTVGYLLLSFLIQD